MRMPSYPRIATGAAAICFFSLAVSAADNKQNDPDQIGNRKVGMHPQSVFDGEGDRTRQRLGATGGAAGQDHR